MEPESDDEFEVECKDSTPSSYICQNNVHSHEQTVKLGKRTHRESYLAEGPAIRNRNDKKRARKAEKVVASKTGSGLDDFCSLLDSDDEIPTTFASFSSWSGRRALPGMVRQNATILMSMHNDCLYMWTDKEMGAFERLKLDLKAI